MDYQTAITIITGSKRQLAKVVLRDQEYDKSVMVILWGKKADIVNKIHIDSIIRINNAYANNVEVYVNNYGDVDIVKHCVILSRVIGVIILQ
ncbi:MAG: hypothetical protein ACXAEU_23730 [Candidatus Hodarchaeales archaeon]|jgi:hypothetical protein